MAEKKTSFKQTVKEYAEVVIVTAIITVILLHFVQISRVVGTSMEPTYHHGQIVFVDKTFYHLKDASHGDVVVAKVAFGDVKEEIIKRVIGLPGDHIVCEEGVMYRNGEKLEESYINEDMYPQSFDVTVSEGTLFIMGDNRNHSTDSREIGCIDFQKDIVGHVFFKF